MRLLPWLLQLWRGRQPRQRLLLLQERLKWQRERRHCPRGRLLRLQQWLKRQQQWLHAHHLPAQAAQRLQRYHVSASYPQQQAQAQQAQQL